MCTSRTLKRMKEAKRKREGHINVVEPDEYCQVSEETNVKPQEEKSKSRIVEKTVFVLTSIGVILLTHGLVWGHWALPWVYVIFTPILVTIKTVCYWKYNWQFFMIDFCYFANTLTFIYLWFPDNEDLFRFVFGLANGPVLVAVAIYRNSLVYHHHDKITSCYIHLMPPLLTFCIRWFPQSTSQYWYKPFPRDAPVFDAVWLYVVPFAFFFSHSIFYFMIINVIVRPKERYLTSYGYLAGKYEKLNCIGRPWGQAVVYYGMNWLFCLTSMLPALLAYNYFPVHCALLALVFLVALWNGGSYYVHVFSERGFDTVE